MANKIRDTVFERGPAREVLGPWRGPSAGLPEGAGAGRAKGDRAGRARATQMTRKTTYTKGPMYTRETRSVIELRIHEYEERDTEVALICPEGPKRKRRKPRDPRGRPEEDNPGGGA